MLPWAIRQGIIAEREREQARLEMDSKESVTPTNVAATAPPTDQGGIVVANVECDGVTSCDS